MSNILSRTAKRAGKLIPKPIRKRIKTTGKRVAQHLPAPVRKAITPRPKRASRPNYPLDPLGLASGVRGASSAAADRHGKAAAEQLAGRAAAGTVLDENASERLHRALVGDATPRRTSTGGRPIAGILAEDLRGDLIGAGHAVHPFVPGSAEAIAGRVEVIVIDLAGFEGVWAGALDPSGIGLFREIYAALTAARARGASCWLVLRGPLLHHHGAISLERSGLLEAVAPGEASREQRHFTEHPGDAPAGIVDIIRNLGGAA